MLGSWIGKYARDNIIIRQRYISLNVDTSDDRDKYRWMSGSMIYYNMGSPSDPGS